MPVSYAITDGKWSVTLRDPIEPQSLEVVQKKLDAGEVYHIGVAHIDIKMLSSLNLAHVGSIDIGGLPCYDLGFLASIKRLESLRLSYITNPSIGKKIRLDSIPSMESLTSLTLRGVSGLKSLPPFPNLQMLNLNGINESLTFLSLSPSIRDITISECNLEEWSQLLHCKNLVRLTVIQVRNADFAELIADGTINDSLKILEISHCPSLTSFSFLKLFSGLKYMDITDCNKLISYKGIEDCRNLVVINISECRVSDKTLTYLAGIKKVLLGISYSKNEVALFDKEFKGEVYSIGRFDKGEFGYTEFYTKYYSSKLDDLPEI